MGRLHRVVNLFFVKELCPFSFSLAGYFMNIDEKCVEILEDKTWIIPSKDVVILCHAAGNVPDIVKLSHAPSE